MEVMKFIHIDPGKRKLPCGQFRKINNPSPPPLNLREGDQPNIWMSLLLLYFLISFHLFHVNPAFAENIQILKISPEDETALIKMPDGKIKVLKVGDRINAQRRVVEIVEGRVVFEERTEHGIETVIIRFEKGKQRVERIRKVEDRRPVLYSPMSKGED